MHLSTLVQNWLESLPGFIGLEAQTLTDIMSEVKEMRAEVSSGEELQKVCGVLPLVLLVAYIF